jgi:hypothetical protein
MDGTLIDLSQATTSTLKAVNGSTVRTITMTASSSASLYAKLSPATNDKYNIGEYNYKFQEVYASHFCGGLRNYISSTNFKSIDWDSSHNFAPDTSNTISLGTSSKQFKNIYGQNIYVNGTAVVSDRNKKEDIEPLNEKHIEFFKALKPVTYKFKDGTSGRNHTGFIAQDVEQAVEDAGLTDKDIAVVVKDQEDNYYLRYEEIIAVQTEVIQKLMAKVDTLETRLARLEGLLANK